MILNKKKFIIFITVQDLDDSKVKELQNNIIDSFSEDPIKYGAEMSFYNNYCYKYCGSFINEGDYILWVNQFKLLYLFLLSGEILLQEK